MMSDGPESQIVNRNRVVIHRPAYQFIVCTITVNNSDLRDVI